MVNLLNLILLPVMAASETVSTGVGDIPVTSGDLVNWVIGVAGGIAGAVAIVLIIKGGYEILSSTGDPQKIQEGRESITNAILGLVLIFASTFILLIVTQIFNIG